MASLVGRQLGDFVLREQIGEGGYAVVYRCEQQPLGRAVVVKVLHKRAQRNDAAMDRFEREAQLASQLDHPYAAHVYAFGAERDGVLWIAMELVHGIALDDWLEARGPMPLAQFVPFFECVADVVRAAHARGIIHRDLKPSNVMVTQHDGRLLPKLLDLGIAKLADEAARSVLERPSGTDAVTTALLRPARARKQRTRTNPEAAAKGHRLTRSGAGLGSMAYMSPEQWDDPQSVGPATDIYALGILIYEALTGRRPFNADSTREYYQQHRHASVPLLGGGLPSDLDRIVQRALAKQPEARHGSAQELAAALRAVLRAQPREQLRSSAQQWQDRARAPGLLWGPDMLADLDRWTRQPPAEPLSELECSFVAASQRRARRSARIRRLLAASAVALAIGGVLYRWEVKAELAETKITQAELEQGRSALLHNEPEALAHLAEAYRRDPSPSTAFMLARAMEPRLAERARFQSTFGRMWSATFSPDATQIVTTDDRNAQVWDAQTYRRRFLLPHGHEVYHAVYSADGRRIVTAAEDAVRIWDAARGTLVHTLTQKRADGQAMDYYLVAVSTDGKLVAAVNAMGSVTHVWDAVTAAAIAELRNDGAEFPNLAFSADGRWLAMTGGKDVLVSDTQTWEPALTIRGPGVRRLAFDPTSPRLLTGATTGDVSLWAVPGATRLHHLREVGEPITAVAFSPDGQLVVAASLDGSEQVWHASSGEPQIQFNPRHSKIMSVEFDRESHLTLTAGTDGIVVITDVASGIPITLLEGPNYILVAHFDPAAQRVAGASWDGTVRVWNAASTYRRWNSPSIADECGLATSQRPDGRFVAVGCKDQVTRVWDTAHDQLIAELPSVSHVEGNLTSALPGISDAGDRAVIAHGNAAEIYELPRGRLLRTVSHTAPVSAVAFAGKGSDLVSGAIDGSLFVARDSGALLGLPASPGGIDAVAFLPDGRIVASNTLRRLRVYDTVGTILADLEIPERVMSLRPEGTRLLTIPISTSTAGLPLLVDLEHYRVIAKLEGHFGRVFSVRWVAGGQIVTAGGDGVVRLWDGLTGQLHQTYRGSSRFLVDAALSPDGLLVAGGAEGVLRFWDAASGQLLWALPVHRSSLIGVHFEGNDIVTRGSMGELSRWRVPDPRHVIDACNDHDRCATLAR